ncbi:response regulator [Pacificoceanicola onchidii]|uniref:response regulator transcription factor n=1 Tax=Pacificoceanicola onchidii TaxID=2562685 RepID=UPI0010A2E560|nr:response regulator transcription factor [Pacificoceanicola onchidii]
MRILVADDHDLVRDTIAAYFDASDIEEVVTVSTLDAAVQAAENTGSFDLVLLDYAMPGMNGLEGLAEMRRANKDRPVAILSGTASPSVADAALKAGAQGFIPKTLAARSLLTAARFMAAGEVYAPLEFMRSREEGGSVLTRREMDVLRGICAGKANKEIARDLELQEVTVKLHVKTLSRKLEARNRTHAAMIARDQGLI